MIGNTYLQLELLKRKIFFKARKVKNSKNSQIKKFTSSFNLIVLNNTKSLSNFISWSNFLEGHYILSQESFDGYIYI